MLQSTITMLRHLITFYSTCLVFLFTNVSAQTPGNALDFNGSSKGERRFRGAYAGEGVNPGWQLAIGLKDAPAGPTPPPRPTGVRVD